MVALAISCVSSVILIIMIERMKLYFYQSAEQKYEKTSCDEGKVLQTSNLSKTYNGNIQAVKGISFDIADNREIVGLLGANGAGKSSTFNMVTMQIKRTKGDIFVFGQDIQNITHLDGVNITAQSDILWPYLSIEEHFRVISLVKGKPNF